MCPEPEFGPEYRALIEIYRLAPEAAAGQLETIKHKGTVLLCSQFAYDPEGDSCQAADLTD